MNTSDKNNVPLFFINPGSGNGKVDWPAAIEEYFSSRQLNYAVMELSNPCKPEEIKRQIAAQRPSRVIAVGGDGTVKLAAEALIGTDIPLGILPAGSANGMAAELGIPNDANEALHIVTGDIIKKIHLVKVNDEYCIHLSDMGFNAFLVKHFEDAAGRGWWSYAKACWKVLWKQRQFNIRLRVAGSTLDRKATMVVIANATRYGTGAVINPVGRLDDDLFEVILLKKISLGELYKMMVSHAPYDSRKTECLQVSEMHIETKKGMHFQVDGEYRGKRNKITASIVPESLHLIVPYL